MQHDAVFLRRVLKPRLTPYTRTYEYICVYEYVTYDRPEALYPTDEYAALGGELMRRRPSIVIIILVRICIWERERFPS